MECTHSPPRRNLPACQMRCRQRNLVCRDLRSSSSCATSLYPRYTTRYTHPIYAPDVRVPWRSVKTRGKDGGRSPRTVHQPSHRPSRSECGVSLSLPRMRRSYPARPHICAGRVRNRVHVPESAHVRRRLWSSCSRAAARTRHPCTPTLLRWQAALSSRAGREGVRERLL